MNVVVTGNPFDGLTIYGPFYDASHANEWADDYCAGEDWWVVEVVTSETDITAS